MEWTLVHCLEGAKDRSIWSYDIRLGWDEARVKCIQSIACSASIACNQRSIIVVITSTLGRSTLPTNAPTDHHRFKHAPRKTSTSLHPTGTANSNHFVSISCFNILIYSTFVSNTWSYYHSRLKQTWQAISYLMPLSHHRQVCTSSMTA